MNLDRELEDQENADLAEEENLLDSDCQILSEYFEETVNVSLRNNRFSLVFMFNNREFFFKKRND